jgi:hypothetical protein
MSLFENEDYRWRETFFVLFHEAERPTADALAQGLQKVNSRYQIDNIRASDTGLFESLTLISADDYAGMDISYVSGEEVQEHTLELIEEMLPLLSAKEKPRLKQLSQYDARLDIYHFEQLVYVGSSGEDDDEMDEFMDPGALLAVLKALAKITGGVGVDQESGTLI